MECNSNCKTCASVCAKSCPICGTKGKKVSNVTVTSLINGDFLFDKTQSAYICVNKKCSVVYFTEIIKLHIVYPTFCFACMTITAKQTVGQTISLSRINICCTFSLSIDRDTIRSFYSTTFHFFTVNGR